MNTGCGARASGAALQLRGFDEVLVAEYQTLHALSAFEPCDDRFDVDLLDASPSLRKLVRGARVVDVTELEVAARGPGES